MSVDISFAAQKSTYTDRWNRMEFIGSSVINSAANTLLKNKSRYQAIEDRTGVPWYFIAICHMRESSADFGTYLGNGQSLKRKTTIVPKGRGPFKSFEDGAVDALTLEGLTDEDDWSLEHILYLSEKYNGFGYMRMGKASPYVWGLTNIAGLGKYVADGQYSATAKETQPGTAALLRRLMDLDSSIKIGPKKTAQEVIDQPLTKSGVMLGSGTAAVGAAGTALDQANMAISTANQTKEGIHKLGVFDGMWTAIHQYPVTFLLLSVVLIGTGIALYSRWKAKKDVVSA